MLGVTTVAADTDEEARRLFTSSQQAFVNLRSGRPGPLPPPREGYADTLEPHQRALLDGILRHAVVGSPSTVCAGLNAFAALHGADELMLTSQIFDHAARRRSYEIAMAALKPDNSTSSPSGLSRGSSVQVEYSL
jgi:alkanesulfonate monooxygenase SsuD/methylene tetrahydromethanopterin reductase-like flavin-dependent oxidoreductase (luciferase family)